jgi:hypothetical protein
MWKNPNEPGPPWQIGVTRIIFYLSVWSGLLSWPMIEFMIGLIIFGLIVYVLLH